MTVLSEALRCCRIGSTKAAVLPVPVCAEASTSRPERAPGITSAWTGEGTVYPSSISARTKGARRPNARNGEAATSWAVSSVMGGFGRGETGPGRSRDVDDSAARGNEGRGGDARRRDGCGGYPPRERWKLNGITLSRGSARVLGAL